MDRKNIRLAIFILKVNKKGKNVKIFYFFFHVGL